MSKASYVEPPNADTAKQFLDACKNGNLNIDGVSLKALVALTSINRKRN